MNLTHARPLTRFCAAAGFTMLSLTACSGSTPANSASAPPSTQTATTQPLSASTIESSESLLPSTPTTAMTQAASGGASKAATAGQDLATKGCSAIPLADVRAVVKSAVTKVDFDPGSAELDPAHSFRCDVDNPTLLITIYPEDASKHTYDQDVAAENVPAVPLAGVGDSAVWTAVSLTPGTYTAAPDVYAHKGAMTCEVQGSGQGLTIPFEPGVVPAITKANVAAFAAKLGVLCDDIFAALG